MIGMTNEKDFMDFLQYYNSIKSSLRKDNVYMNKKTYNKLGEEALQALKERNIGVIKTEYIEDDKIYLIPETYVSFPSLLPIQGGNNELF